MCKYGNNKGVFEVIVQSSQPVTLVGGAQVSAASVESVLIFAPKLVAADGGADTIFDLGLRPEAVIGDMDSIKAEARAAFADCLTVIAEQDSTDFDKALRSIDAPLVLAVGVSGGRLDHELAAMHVLLRYPERPCVIVGPESMAFVCPSEISFSLPPGTPLSLFPFSPVNVRSEGLRWPTAGLAFSPVDKIGTSNEVVGPVTLWADAPNMMVVLPVETLPALIVPLQAAATWPVRAQ